MHPADDTDKLGTIDRWFGQLGLWMYGHRLIVFALVSALLAGAVMCAATIRTDNSFDAFFDASDPSYNAYIRYQDDFGSDEIAYILYRVSGAPNGPFDLEAMGKIARLTQALEDEVPFLREVTSLTNVEFMQAEGDFLEIT
ncbi:MAG: hypothetical protein KDI21_21585, partial [Halieaceae bacterium]|nr:hypothetical protein [Halieaceae bacterium]